jgi:hypothetical protein
MACNLSKDPSGAADFVGSTGKTVSLTVNGTAGSTTVIKAFYAGAPVASTSPVSFTIKSGDQLLELVIENTLAADPTMVVCDDGTLLDRFRFDRNNPVRIYDVRGT